MARLEYLRSYDKRVMSDIGVESTVKNILPDAQRRAIVGIADIRRQTQFLGIELDLLTKNQDYRSITEPLQSAYDDEYRLVAQTMQGIGIGDVGTNTSQTSIITQLLSDAEIYKNFAPRMAALNYAQAAALQQVTGSEYGDSLDRAKQCLGIAQKSGISRNVPADFLPDALILGIAKKAAGGVEIPSPDIVAQEIQIDPSLLKDYALVLPESQREAFLQAFPPQRRTEVSIQLDRAVSEVLNKRYITDAGEITQRDAIKDRVQEVFTASLGKLKNPEGEQPIGYKWTSKQLVQTIVNLGEEDSLRLLRDLSENTTSELKALNKKFKKMPPAERSHALGPVMSFTARVLDTLIEADIKRGGVLTMRYLEMTALPDRLFTFFANKLTKEGYFTQQLNGFLKDSTNIPVIKKLMAQYGPQFNTIIETVAQTPDYTADHKLLPHEAELFEALADLSTLTPRIFDRYRQLSPEQRKTFAERIRILKPQFFGNTPIKGILGSSDRDILTEMVYMAYKPMGMSFEQVENLIRKVDDHTDDISRYSFPSGGYPLTLERSSKYIVKEQQQPDLASFRRYRDLLTPRLTEPNSEQSGKSFSFAQALQQILQSETQYGHPSQLERSTDEPLRVLLQPLHGQARIQEFLGRSNEISADSAFQVEGELAEIMGVYFRDNYSTAVTNYLTSHQDEFQQLMGIINNENIRTLINNKLSESSRGFDWAGLDRGSQITSRGIFGGFFARPTTSNQQALVAQLITQLVEHDQVEPIRKHINNELSKFTLTGTESSHYKGALRAYISKNVGSFFAKAAAGICTAEDIPLFERSDHFHINVVENDEVVRANVQAYIARVDGKPSLVLRGFNPTADWMGKIDIENFCEQILMLGRQFQRENGLSGVYITEQGSWHALSNRDQVARYLMKRYEDGKATIPSDLQVSTGHKVSSIYRV